MVEGAGVLTHHSSPSRYPFLTAARPPFVIPAKARIQSAPTWAICVGGAPYMLVQARALSAFREGLLLFHNEFVFQLFKCSLSGGEFFVRNIFRVRISSEIVDLIETRANL